MNEDQPLGQKSQFQHVISGSLSSIIRGFKIGVSKQIKTSIWQRNDQKHMIRSQESYQKISEYILTNPSKWKENKFFTN